MVGRKRRLALRGVLVGVAGLVGAASLWVVVGPTVRHWRVEREIALFERTPSQAGADDLVGLLERHAATTEQGERILGLLLKPAVIKRPAYAAGRPVSFVLERPFRLDFQGTQWQSDEVEIEGTFLGTTSGAWGRAMNPICLQGLNAYQADPGVHRIKVECRFGIGLERRNLLVAVVKRLRRVPGAGWLGVPTAWQPACTYECGFEIPVEVTVVPEAEAETVELVSSPKLDAAMQAAFGLGACGSGDLRYIAELNCRNLPIDVAFRTRLLLFDEEGDAVPISQPGRSQRGQWVGSAGYSGHLRLDHRARYIHTGTTYSGLFVLEADPEYAYRDPTITRIWGGALEIPFSYDASTGRVTVQPGGPRVRRAEQDASTGAGEGYRTLRREAERD